MINTTKTSSGSTASAFLYGVALQWKLSIRNKDMIIFYVVPLAFYLIMGSVFSSIIPDVGKTLIQTMIVFSVTMGGVLGVPNSLIANYKTEIKKSFRVGNVPLSTILIGNFIASFINLFIVSMIIFATAPVLYKAEIPQHLPEFFISLSLLILTSISIGNIFGLFIKSSSKLGLFTQIVFLPSIMLSGIMFPVSMLPKPLQWVGNVLPATWGFKAMCGTDLIQTVPLTVILILTIIISIWKLNAIKTE